MDTLKPGETLNSRLTDLKSNLIGCLGNLTPLQAGFVALAAVGIAAATKAIGEFINLTHY